MNSQQPQPQPQSEKSAMPAPSANRDFEQPPPAYQIPLQGGAAVYPTVPQQAINMPPYVISQDHIVFGKYSVNCICPNCKKNVTTLVSFENSIVIWIAFLVLIFVCFFLCWVPFAIKGLKDIVHTCPNCKVEISRTNIATRI